LTRSRDRYYGSCVTGVIKSKPVWLYQGALVGNGSTFPIKGDAETYEHFGWAVAAGYFGAGPQHDLPIGVPDENLNAGAVSMIFGGDEKPLSAADSRLLLQDDIYFSGKS